MYIEKIKLIQLSNIDVMNLKTIEGNNSRIKFVEEFNGNFINPNFEKLTIFENAIYSNEIENISTSSEARDKELLKNKDPRNINEQLILNLNNLLEEIYTSFNDYPITKNTMLYFHKMLYSNTNITHAGKLVGGSQVIQNNNGKIDVLFKGSSVFEVNSDIDKLFDAYAKSQLNDFVDEVVLAIVFIINFALVHPFADGNGRISRLFLQHMLLTSGYTFVKYSSIDKIINETKIKYYYTLRQSNEDWTNRVFDMHSVAPFISYMLEVLAKASKDAMDKINKIARAKRTDIFKSIVDVISSYQSNELFSRKDIREKLGIKVSEVYLSKSMTKLTKDMKIERTGDRKSTKYKKI